MATTTPNFGWDVPQSTDLVKDGATAIAALGNDIDTSLVDLKGGTTGQVLSKNSNTDMDFTWVAQDDSNAIQNAIVDAKGDLISATAADTPARLAVGTNGQVLTADSAQSTGLKWANPSTSPSQVSLQLSGGYIKTPSLQATSSGNQTEDITVFSPIYLAGIAFDRIGVQTASSFTGTATVRLGIYNADLTSGKPTTVYLDAGTVSCTAASTDYLITISTTPPAGLYFLAFNMQTTATAPNFTSSGGGNNALASQNVSTISVANKTSYWTQSAVTGAFATASVDGSTTGAAVVVLRMV